MEYKNVNDYEVMYMIRENDEEARNLMFQKYHPSIKKIAYKYYDFAKKCGSELEDLIQEGMIALNKAIDSYQESSGVLFYTYVTLCIERHLITYCRNISSYRHASLNNNVGDDILFNISDSKNGIEDFFSEKLEEEMFIYYKNLLNFKFSIVFELRYNGFSYKEIGNLLDLPISTIDGRLCKIRKFLQERVEKFI